MTIGNIHEQDLVLKGVALFLEADNKNVSKRVENVSKTCRFLILATQFAEGEA
jgi:hypothetical protein